MNLNGQWKGTREAIEQARLSLNEVWMRYFSISGEAGDYEIDAYLNGSFILSSIQADLLAHAVNELIDQMPRPLQRGEAQGHQRPPNRTFRRHLTRTTPVATSPPGPCSPALTVQALGEGSLRRIPTIPYQGTAAGTHHPSPAARRSGKNCTSERTPRKRSNARQVRGCVISLQLVRTLITTSIGD